MPFWTSAEFWLGIAGIAGTAVVAIWAQAAQTRRADRGREEERRRLRREELADAYRALGEHASRSIAHIRADLAGDVPAPTPAEERMMYHEGRHLAKSLRMVGANEPVRDAWEGYVAALVQVQDQSRNDPDPRLTGMLDEALDRFYDAANDHLEAVWPSPDS